MDLQQVLTLLGLVIGTGVATEIAKGIIGWINGKTADKREQHKQIEEQRKEDATLRLKWREHAHVVRRMALDNGVPFDKLPQLPEED